MGTSFASAILAKDTMTSNGQLVNKNTNEAVATADAVNDYTVGEDDGDYARTLQQCNGVDLDASTSDVCDTSALTPTTMTKVNALAMLKDCKTNKKVMLRHTVGDLVTTKMVCDPSMCSGSTYQMPGPKSGELCIQGSTEKLIVNVDPTDANVYILSKDIFAEDQIFTAVCPQVPPASNEKCSGGYTNCGYNPVLGCDGTTYYDTTFCSCESGITQCLAYGILPCNTPPPAPATI